MACDSKNIWPAVVSGPFCDSQLSLPSVLASTTVLVVEAEEKIDRFTAAIALATVVCDGFPLDALSAFAFPTTLR